MIGAPSPGELAGTTATAFELPSTGPEPIPFDTAVAAVLGYARGLRPIYFRSIGVSRGRWVMVPAFGWSRYDTRPPRDKRTDTLIGEALHGRLQHDDWVDARDALVRARPLADVTVDRAGGLPLWELPDEQLSVLGEPGTVGAGLREMGRVIGGHAAHVVAILHHAHPGLIPHITRITRLALLPHLEEGDSDVAAVVWRELNINAVAFARLERVIAELVGDARPTRLRLHDILLWLTTTLRLAHAVALGHETEEWRRYRAQ